MQGLKRRIRDNRYINWILILSNWVFQGIPNLDWSEKTYRVLFTIFFWLFILFTFINYSTFSFLQSIALSFIIAHTLNWIVNSNFYGLIIHNLLLSKLSKENLFEYIEILEQRTKTQKWIIYAASFGSICRGELTDSSDIDISIVRKPGFVNALKSLKFSIKEKKYADLKGIPLEIYISDSPENSISKFAAENNPVILFDPENTIDKYYQEKLTITEAIKLNS